MVVKCADELRGNIFKYIKNLKGQTNSLDEAFFVDPQLPEEMSAQRRRTNAAIAEIKKINKTLPDQQKAKFEVKNRQLYVNGELQKEKVCPPSTTEMLNLKPKEIDRILQIELAESSIHEEKGSIFYGYAAQISTVNDIADRYRKVKYWHPDSDHIVMAAKIGQNFVSCDDGEYNAGLKLQKMLQQRQEVNNSVVFVAREYGNTRLGPRRFHIINNLANEALDKLNQTK